MLSWSIKDKPPVVTTTCANCKFWSVQQTHFSPTVGDYGEPVVTPGNSKLNKNWGLCRARAPIAGPNNRTWALTHQNDWCGDFVVTP